MDDKTIESTLLTCEKNCCDLFQHAAIEASTPKVRQTFTNAFNDTLTMCDTLYQQMTAKGWYQADNAPAQKLTEIRQKFTPTC